MLRNDQLFLPEGTKPESINKERLGVALTSAEVRVEGLPGMILSAGPVEDERRG